MIGVPVSHDMNGFLNNREGRYAVSLFTVEMDVMQVIINQRGAIPSVPSQILHHIDPLCKLVITDCISQERIIGQDPNGVFYAALDLPFLRCLQKIRHGLCRHIRLE